MIRLCAPEFDAEDHARVAAVLDSGQLVQGPVVEAFEAQLGAWLGVPAVACQSGTSALYLALRAAGVVPGDEVVMPALTWPAAAQCIVSLGATPRFVDVDPDGLNATADAILAAVTPRTRAVIPIHQFGVPAEVAALVGALRGSGVAVVEDAACAIGSTCDGKRAGTVGDFGCFSFHPRKIVTTGEGGAVVARDPDALDRVRRQRNHGQDPRGAMHRFTDVGLNFRMPELCAAIGIGQLVRLADILAVRARRAARYLAALSGVPGIRVPAAMSAAGCSHQSFVVDVGSAARRARVMDACAAAGIQTTIGTYAVTAQPVFRALGADPAQTPRAVELMERLITLPLHQGMTGDDVDRVVAVVHEAMEAT